MNKQFQGSKKKARKAAYLIRKAERDKRKNFWPSVHKAMEEGGIEAAAKIMGVKLK
jgi:hypothetical protein